MTRVSLTEREVLVLRKVLEGELSMVEDYPKGLTGGGYLYEARELKALLRKLARATVA